MLDRAKGSEGGGVGVLEGTDAGGFKAYGAGWEELQVGDAFGLINVIHKSTSNTRKLKRHVIIQLHGYIRTATAGTAYTG